MSLARTIVRRRGIIAACWVLTAILVGARAAHIEQVLDVSAVVPSSESAAVDDLLGKRFDSPFAHYAVLVVTGLPSPAIVPGQDALGELSDSIAVAPGVTRVLSYLDAHDSLFLGARETSATFLVVGLDAKGGPLDALIPPLRHAGDVIARRMRARHPAIALAWTGEVALNYDLRRTSADDARRAELRALPLTLVLLGLAFGSIVAALLPVGAGTLAIITTLGIASLVATRMPLSILLENVVSMLGLGLGIDYALLIVSRFREGMAAGMAADDAAEEAARHAGHTVMMSGIAVAVGFAALLVVPLNELRAVAVGGLLVSLFSVLVATTLLPGVLAWLGARADAGRLFRRKSPSPHAANSRWFRWGAFVARHPRVLVVVLGAPVVLLALQSRRLSTELPRGDWLPPKMESARGLATLRALGRGGVLQTIRVVIELPPNTPALGADGWRATRAFADALARDPRIVGARS
ncbi:MAG: MMPL family transporter, partial [Gemmatimonadota bacterium]|nr:MMPL family transporter [Gemmatimonadota bacterium]